ncbi:MAG: [glutamine synthetase] adenylyltransferase / [glutamine synthetase]-adenylyl-L-tyrosine, partial [Alphaproteobacteria bacterium]|nr:[glutamine synthetase] adenylyltransferase / [glutamine synthetase]-adenylyl-L-tyrosine [Alphaproteobacteria bacterium]
MVERVSNAGQGTLAQRVVAAPTLLAPQAAHARVADWLAEIAATPAGASLKRLLDRHPEAHALIAGIAEGSPYLWELARAEPARLATLLDSDPDRRLDTVLAEASRVIAASADEAEVMRCLRRMKSEAALLIALADIGGVWPVPRVTLALTMLADATLGAAVRHLFAEAARRGRYLPADRDRPEQDSGYVALAMGKMGAHELNYSSDIDLIVLYDADSAALATGAEPAALFVR